MKKFAALTLLGLSTVAVAETAPAPVQDSAQPVLALAVYDISKASEQKMLEKRELSRSNKNHRLCWTAANVNAVENGANFAIEQFVSPASTTLTDDEGTIAQRSKDGKTHVLLSFVPTFKDGLVEKCWHLPSKYPTGEYQFTARVNDFEFPIQTFKIVE